MHKNREMKGQRQRQKTVCLPQHPQHKHSRHSTQHSQASSQRKQQHIVIKLCSINQPHPSVPSFQSETYQAVKHPRSFCSGGGAC
ncbi:hypothetical protein BJY04DRAFT_203945 [Aspergillus karnatakaensis]|uniref:uncharacterized protein n=1 Tax=Aspergillus karnatakaensis TaxID=1810916 RepID=UPI003CCDF04D